MAIVNKRQDHITVILKYWNQGDITSALSAINMMNDPSVIMDVFSSTFADGLCMESITLDHVVYILPLSLGLIASKYDPYIQAGVKTVQTMLNTFGDVNMIFYYLLFRKLKMQKLHLFLEELIWRERRE